MDLKEFITETISSIANAAAELQRELAGLGVIVNPPVDANDSTAFSVQSGRHTYRRIQTIEFDVAVTASSETSAGGKGGLRVLSFEASAEGMHSRHSEQVSRVKFSIPLVLSPSEAESDAIEKNGRDLSELNKRAPKPNPGSSWMGR